MLLTNLSREYLNKYVMKYIYNDKVSTTLTEMRGLKWKHRKKTGKQKPFPKQDLMQIHTSIELRELCTMLMRC